MGIIRISDDYPYQAELAEGIAKEWFPVFVKYPVYPIPRFNKDGKGPHPGLYEILDQGREGYNLELRRLAKHCDQLLKIRTDQPDDSPEPCWNNPWFSGLDAVALYGYLAEMKPRLFVEIGSGNSTKFAKQAISDHHLSTKIISIDPCPRTEIDHLADEIIRLPLEKMEMDWFDQLTQNDVLFFDGSHRCFMNSDVTVFFLEVMPRLPAGIHIHIHDIHLPYDYPAIRAQHYESEQYLVAAMLLAGCKKYRIMLPNTFITNDIHLEKNLSRLWDSVDPCIPKKGNSLWLMKSETSGV